MPTQKKATLMESAYHLILEKIVRERLTPGTPLRESRLAREFNLSPTPIREAFRRLENEGWLQNLPFRGCVLRQYSTEELRDLFSLREAIECTLVRSAIKRATPADFQKMAEVLEREREYTNAQAENFPNENMLSPTELDIAFHDAIMNAARTPGLKRRSDLLQAQINYIILLNSHTPMIPDDMASVYEEHSMIFFAMRRKWVDIAEALIRNHIRLGWNKYRMFMKKNPPEPPPKKRRRNRRTVTSP